MNHLGGPKSLFQERLLLAQKNIHLSIVTYVTIHKAPRRVLKRKEAK